MSSSRSSSSLMQKAQCRGRSDKGLRYLSRRNGCCFPLGIAAWYWTSMFNTGTHSAVQGILSACTAISWRRRPPKRHVAILLCTCLNWWCHPMLDNVARPEHLRVERIKLNLAKVRQHSVERRRSRITKLAACSDARLTCLEKKDGR